MKKIMVNGKEITTNYGQTYRLCKGDSKNGYTIKIRESVLTEGDMYRHKESDKEMLERLVSLGYTTILFAETSTCIRGYHDLFAYAKR